MAMSHTCMTVERAPPRVPDGVGTSRVPVQFMRRGGHHEVQADHVWPESASCPSALDANSLTYEFTSYPTHTAMKTYQVTPLSLDEVTVTIPLENKGEKQVETRTLQQNLRLGLLYTLVSLTAIYLLMAAIEFINDGLLLLLAATQQH